MSRYDLAAEQADHALACAERLAEIRQLLSCPEGGEVAAVRRLIGDARDPAHCYTCDRPKADCACHEPSFACNFDVRN